MYQMYIYAQTQNRNGCLSWWEIEIVSAHQPMPRPSDPTFKDLSGQIYDHSSSKPSFVLEWLVT